MLRTFGAIASAVLLHSLWLSSACTAADINAGPEIAAIEFLGTVDCYWYPEAQEVLIKSLTNDPREKVRYAAVLALTQQAQRGKSPLDPTSGWRKVPDPEIFRQIIRLMSFRKPYTHQELMQRYRERQSNYQSKKDARRGDEQCGCCTEELIQALSRTAYEKDLFGCWLEPSERVRWRAEMALQLCCDATSAQSYLSPYENWMKSEEPPTVPPPMVQNVPDEFQFASQLPTSGESFQPTGIGMLGRADFSNRFNIFDNMSAAPRSRVFYGFQLADAQNNGVFLTGDTNKLFSILDTPSGRAEFIQVTGFGRQPGMPSINPNDPASKEELKAQFLTANGGRTQAYLQRPDTHLHRFGFEYALTPDFSVFAMTQYVIPSGDNEQPNSYSNPSIQLKHVFFRSEQNLLSAVFNIQPQISRPKYSIGEDTTRLSPGLLTYHRLNDRLFMQNAFSFSFPTESHKITTFDYAIGGGWWAYKHESLEPWYRGPKPDAFVLGFVPQFEALGRTIIGSNEVVGQFDLKSNQAQTAPGTFAYDSTRNIYFPQDGGLFQQSAFIYRESRDVVDLTAGASLIMKYNVVFSSAVSFPVTGGNARSVEFIATLNKYF